MTDDVTDPVADPVTEAEHPGRWETFAGWHREPSLYREIYARTVSALAAGFVIYLVAALSGLVSRKPLLVLLVLGGIGGMGAYFWLYRFYDPDVPEERKPRRYAWMGLVVCAVSFIAALAIGYSLPDKYALW